MVSGTGIDIVEVDRIKRSVEKGDRFKTLVFSSREINYCENNGSGFESYAGRFAAKEAFFKALGTGWGEGMAFYEVEILNDHLGKPLINLSGATKQLVEKRKVRKIHVSISHAKHFATAMVIIEE